MIRIVESRSFDPETIFARRNADLNVSAPVARILADVARLGDEALFEYTGMFDGVQLDRLEVTEEEWSQAFSGTDALFRSVLEQAAANIRAFHRQQLRDGFTLRREKGVVIGQKITPIDKVGLYVPGGTAAYPSTVLMDAIPAKLAGCPELIMVTPPGRDGKIAPAILAAAKIAGVDRIFKIGGAQAIAALAYGTQSVPAVCKIVGPGNAYVSEAKRQVFGRVAIDMVAGPSEVLILAGEGSDARVIAADMLAQSEHDRLAAAVLVTDSRVLAKAVDKELERQLPLLPRAEIAGASVKNNGAVIIAEDLDEAIAIANRIAPEHLELFAADPFPLLNKIRNAGSVFLGKNTPEALGDYLAGPNHTLPTGGSARFASPLSVDDFVKRTQFTYFTEEALAEVKDNVALFARREGLEAHARSALIRFGEEI